MVTVGHKRVAKEVIEDIPIPFPPLPEQKRIVAILDEAFEGIGAAVANAEKNLANARELFDSYLNSVFSQKGEGWVEKTFGRSADAQRGMNHTSISKEMNTQMECLYPSTDWRC